MWIESLVIASQSVFFKFVEIRLIIVPFSLLIVKISEEFPLSLIVSKFSLKKWQNSNKKSTLRIYTFKKYNNSNMHNPLAQTDIYYKCLL